MKAIPGKLSPHLNRENRPGGMNLGIFSWFLKKVLPLVMLLVGKALSCENFRLQNKALICYLFRFHICRRGRRIANL